MKTTQKKELPSGFFFDEVKHKYYYNGKEMTGVTSMLSKTIAKPALIQWAANKSIEHIKANLSYKRLKLLRKGYIIVRERILEEARVAHASIRDDAADFGKDVHGEIEAYIKECIRQNDGKPMLPLLEKSAQLGTFIDWAIRNEVTFLASEAVFYSPELFLAGTADVVFLDKHGHKVIGDVKVKKRIYGREPFLQMAAYHMLSEGMGNEKGEKSVVLRIDPITAELEELWSYNVAGDRDALFATLQVYRYLHQ